MICVDKLRPIYGGLQMALFMLMFLRFLEQRLFVKVHRPYCYVYYVDNAFACFSSHNEELIFFYCLNRFHLSLPFYYGRGKRMLLLLDMLVEKVFSSFITNVYCKPTFTGLYTSWESFCPKVGED